MKRRRSKRTEKSDGIEWLGGSAVVPAYVTGEGEHYRPEILVWLDADGVVQHVTSARPSELLSAASESLQQAIDEPMSGNPHSPTRVRVASAELANALRAGHPTLEVVCAPTPELDEQLDQMREQMAAFAEEGEPSYLSNDVRPDAVAAFFQAAAALFRAAPWKIAPDDQSLFSVTSAQLDLHDAVLSVIGQMGESFGLILFENLDAFEQYLDAADAMERGMAVELPSHFVINFDRGAEVPTELRKEIAEHGWEVAGADAYPSVMVIDEDRGQLDVL